MPRSKIKIIKKQKASIEKKKKRMNKSIDALREIIRLNRESDEMLNSKYLNKNFQNISEDDKMRLKSVLGLQYNQVYLTNHAIEELRKVDETINQTVSLLLEKLQIFNNPFTKICGLKKKNKSEVDCDKAYTLMVALEECGLFDYEEVEKEIFDLPNNKRVNVKRFTSSNREVVDKFLSSYRCIELDEIKEMHYICPIGDKKRYIHLSSKKVRNLTHEIIDEKFKKNNWHPNTSYKIISSKMQIGEYVKVGKSFLSLDTKKTNPNCTKCGISRKEHPKLFSLYKKKCKTCFKNRISVGKLCIEFTDKVYRISNIGWLSISCKYVTSCDGIKSGNIN